MIDIKDQEQLLKLISNLLKEDIVCTAIGGTAMMFLGYKETTKDIDLVFNDEKERQIFIEAIKEIGYKEKSLSGIYDQEHREHKKRPKMFSRGDERFDLFLKDVFGYKLGKKFIERRDFIGKKELIVYVLSEEELILLKGITGREKDYEDIETIMNTNKEIDWDLIVDNAIKQKTSNSWILIDLEENLQKLKEKFFIPHQIFDKIHQAEGKV